MAVHDDLSKEAEKYFNLAKGTANSTVADGNYYIQAALFCQIRARYELEKARLASIGANI